MISCISLLLFILLLFKYLFRLYSSCYGGHSHVHIHILYASARIAPSAVLEGGGVDGCRMGLPVGRWIAWVQQGASHSCRCRSRDTTLTIVRRRVRDVCRDARTAGVGCVCVGCVLYITSLCALLLFYSQMRRICSVSCRVFDRTQKSGGTRDPRFAAA